MSQNRHRCRSRGGKSKDTLTESVYDYATTGLFEKHKLLFSFQMTCKLQEAYGEMVDSELQFFIKGNISLEKSERPKPHPWLPDQGWQDIIKLTEISKEAARGSLVMAALACRPQARSKGATLWRQRTTLQQWMGRCGLRTAASWTNSLPSLESSSHTRDKASFWR